MSAVDLIHNTHRLPGLRRFCRRLLPTTLLGWAAMLGGCAAFAGFAAAVLTGIFLGRVAASLQATANSYHFSDAGDVGLVFQPAPLNTVSLVRFFGRLPGFHIVFIRTKDATRMQAPEAVLYDTDVDIDFSTSPPTITGQAKERDGEDTIPLNELYPNIPTVTGEISAPDANGGRRLTLRVGGLNASGDEIEYALVLNVEPVSETGLLSASVEVERTFTPMGGEPEVITGTGSFNASREPEEP